MFLIARFNEPKQCWEYAARHGEEHTFTRDVERIQFYTTEKEAREELCFVNERVVSVHELSHLGE